MEDVSPTMMYGNCIVWSGTTRDWRNDVLTVIIEEDNELSFRIVPVEGMPMIGAPFSANPSIRILSKPVPTTHNSSINMAQVNMLTSFVRFLNASGKCWTVTQKVREASSDVSDSDDEQLPDPAIPPAFSNSELLFVQSYYEKLHNAFRSAVVHRFSNAPGKMFFYHLAEFILVLRPNKQHMPYTSALIRMVS